MASSLGLRRFSASGCFGSVWSYRSPIAGLLVTVTLAVLRQTSPSEWQLRIPVGIFAYLTCLGIALGVLSNQTTFQSFEMTWQATGRSNRAGEPEIRLEFVRHPGNFIDVYGSGLRNDQTAVGSRPLHVEFRVPSAFGCVRGYAATRIDQQGPKQGFWVRGEAVSNGTPSPWSRRHWWCC
jgi:hypothetical protein